MGDVDREWIYKISKKIVSLTKTVFKLHAEAVARKDILEAKKVEYEEEIVEAEEMSRHMLEQARTQVDNYCENMDVMVKQAYEKEFAKVKQEFESVKRNLDLQSQRIIDAATKRIEELTAQTGELKQKADAHTRRCGSLKSEAAQASTRVDERNRKRRLKVEMETSAKCEKVRERKFESEMEDAHRMIVTGGNTKDVKQMTEMEEMLKRIESEKTAILDRIDAMKKSVHTQAKDIYKQLKGASSLGELRVVFEKRQADRHDQGTSKGNIEGSMERYRDEVRAQVEEMECEIERAKTEHAKQLSALDGVLATPGDEIGGEHSQAVAKIIAEHDKFMRDAKLREAEVQMETQERRKAFREEVERLREAVSNEKQKHQVVMDKMRKAHEEDLGQIRKQHEELFARLKDDIGSTSAGSLDELIRQIARVKEEIALGKAKENESTLATLAMAHEAEIARIKAAHASRLEKLEADTEKKIGKMKEKHGRLMKAIDREADESLVQHMNELKAGMAVRTQRELEAIRESWNAKLSQLRERIRVEQGNGAEANECFEVGEAARIRAETSAIELAWNEEKEHLNTEYQECMIRIKEQREEIEEHDKEMRLMKDEECARVIDQLKQELEDESTRNAILNNELAASVADQRLTTAHGGFKKLSIRRTPVIDDLQSEFERVTRETEERLTEIELEKEQECTELHERLKATREKGERELTELRQRYEATKEAQNQRIENLKQQITTEEQTANSELVRARTVSEDELRQIEAQQRTELHGLNDVLDQLRSESEEQRQRHQEVLDKQQREYDGRVAAMTEKFEEDKGAVTRDIADIEKSKRQTITELEEEARQWNASQSTKKSRPEDLERIRMLEAMIQERNEAIDRVQKAKRSRPESYNDDVQNMARCRPQTSIFVPVERRARNEASATLPPLSKLRGSRDGKPR